MATASTTVTLRGLTLGVSYCIEVSAVNIAGRGYATGTDFRAGSNAPVTEGTCYRRYLYSRAYTSAVQTLYRVYIA